MSQPSVCLLSSLHLDSPSQPAPLLLESPLLQPRQLWPRLLLEALLDVPQLSHLPRTSLDLSGCGVCLSGLVCRGLKSSRYLAGLSVQLALGGAGGGDPGVLGRFFPPALIREVLFRLPAPVV